MNGTRALALLVALFTGMIAALVALAVFGRAASPFDIATGAADRVLVPVGSTESDESVPGELQLEYTESAPISGGPISGRVTALASAITPFDSVIAVDGIARPAVFAATPPYRQLKTGVHGADVDAIADLLLSQQMLNSWTPGSAVDPAFTDAVSDFERAQGWPTSGVFEPDYVVWFPVGWGGPTRFAVRIGESITPQQVLIAAAAHLNAAHATLTDATSGTLPTDGALQFSVLDGPTVWLDDSDATAAVTDLDPLEPLVAADPPPATLDGVIALRQPVTRQTVPTSAVIVGAGDATCVLTDTEQVERIVVTGGRSGVTEISPTLAADTRVVADPPSSTADSCH